MPEAANALNPPARLARYSNKKLTQYFKEWISGTPGLNKGFRNRNGVDFVSCLGNLGTSSYAGNFGFGLVISKVVEDSLKRTIIAEISQIEVPKEGDPLSLAFVRVHTTTPSESRYERNYRHRPGSFC
jgi:hypothetical protein